jgi:threonine/homoserine/homoserine lactone efflux protein
MSTSGLELLGLLGALFALAALPTMSSLAVSARAATAGFGQGAVVALGVVIGDLVFIALALIGLSLLDVLPPLAWTLFNYLVAAYLSGAAVWLWRQADRPPELPGAARHVSSFGTGLAITLADQKAVLFYLGFLPAFVGARERGVADLLAIVAVAIVAVGTAKLGYAWAGARAGASAGARSAGPLRRIAAASMLLVAALLILRA